MRVTGSIQETESLIRGLKTGARKVGLVPTMGSLHEGHLSLLRQSVAENEINVVSIFVNPTQFNEKQDFESYPRDMERDLDILGEFPVDLVFAPAPEEIYPEPDTRVFDFGGLDLIMEGKHRPGHFNGVAQVVSKLFEIVKPDRAYFGEKDFQQLAIIKKITGDLGLPVEIMTCPIIREEDGLAMSSRNRLLSPEERKSAPRIYRSLKEGRSLAGRVPVSELITRCIQYIEVDPRLETEYFDIVDERSLEAVGDWTESTGIRAAVAVRIGNVRLIDNMDFSF